MNATAVHPHVDASAGIGDAPADRGGDSATGRRVVCALKIAAGLALLAWTLWALWRDGALGAGVVYLGFTSFVFLGVGHLALWLAGVDERGVTWLGLRYIVGFALSAFLMTVAGSAGIAGLALWLALAVGVAGWGVAAWELLTRRLPRPGGSLIGGELLVGAALLRVVVEGTGYWRVVGRTSVFTQYFDMLYHLALVKSGIDRGLPLRGWVLETGVSLPGYHPGFDTMTSVLIKGLHLPVDAAFFRLALPVTLFGMLIGIGVLAAAWARSRRAGLLALGFVGLTFAVTLLPAAVTTVIGDVGLNNLRYFVFNPPSVLAAIAGTACLALVALADERRAGALVLAGLLAGATTLMKANFAIVLVPAFVLALTGLALRRRRGRLVAAAGVAAAALTFVVAYPTTMGTADPLALGLGKLGTHLLLVAGGTGELHSYSRLFTKLAGPLGRRGPTGDALLVLLYIVTVALGWWLIVTLLATWRARAAGERPFGRSPAASLVVLAIGCLTTLVALFVAQRGDGYLSSWNITWHTVQNLWWLALCAAAVALEAALGGRRSSAAPGERRPWRAATGRVAVVALAAVLLSVSVHGVATARQADHDMPLPSDLRSLLQELDAYVPVSARVVQDRDTTTYNWVSALAGRGAVLERSSWTQWLYPARTTQLQNDIDVLYGTPSSATARRVARNAGAQFAVIDLTHQSAPGLKAISSVVLRQGDWALLKLR